MYWNELGMEHMGESKTQNFSLFGTKGYWRNAWKVTRGLKGLETIVLKTLKYVGQSFDVTIMSVGLTVFPFQIPAQF